MKKMLSIMFLVTFNMFAQTYSTGTMTFVSGFTGKVDTNSTQVTLTLSGPSDRWFAVGFGTSSMGSGDCVYYNGSTLVDSHLVGYGSPSTTSDTQNWTVSSNTISGTTRTIVATRALNTGDVNDYVFSNSANSYSMIWARCATATTSIGTGHNSASGSFRGSLTANAVLANADFETAMLKLSSNPVKDNFKIDLPNDINEATLAIYDLEGKKDKEIILTANNQNIISVNDLPHGVYILNLQSVKGNFTKKIIIE